MSSYNECFRDRKGSTDPAFKGHEVAKQPIHNAFKGHAPKRLRSNQPLRPRSEEIAKQPILQCIEDHAAPRRL
jgi:hypothetical protein